MLKLNRFFSLLLLVYFCSLIYISYFSVQNHFVGILIPYITGFFCFFCILKTLGKEDNFRKFLSVVLLLKLTIVFSFPHLSDDIYRFWWDGYIANQNINPFEFRPDELLNLPLPRTILLALTENFKSLNSQNYHSVYPMICQWLFQFAAMISDDNLMLFNVVLKLIFLFSDCLLLFVLWKLLTVYRIPKEMTLVYFGNPLCIIELNVNLHFEIFLILFLVCGFYFHATKHFALSGASLALSIASKLISSLFFFLFIKRPLFQKSNFLFLICFIISFSILFYPLVAHQDNYQTSLGLYFNKFEFNSFIYNNTIQFLDYMQWNLPNQYVGVIFVSIFIIFYISFVLLHFTKINSQFMLYSAWMILFVYLLLSPTVHPWYITPIIVLGIFYFKNTSLAWGALIVLSYVRYDPILISYEPYFIISEYLVVMGTFTYELIKSRVELKAA